MTDATLPGAAGTIPVEQTGSGDRLATMSARARLIAGTLVIAIAVGGMIAAVEAPGRGISVTTAITFFIALAALYANRSRRSLVARLAAASVSAIGAAAGTLHIASGFASAPPAAGQPFAVLLEIAPLTSFAFVFAGVALLLASKAPRGVEFVVAVPAAAAFAVVLGHLFGSPELTSIGTTIPMSISAAAALLALVVAIVASVPESGIMRLLASSSPGGYTARRLLLAALFLPALMAWLRLLGQRRGLYGTEMGLTIYTLGVTIVLLAIVFLTTKRLDTIDRERRIQEKRVEDAEARFRTFMEKSPDAILIAERDARIQLVNAAAEKMFGYSREELVGADVTALIRSEYRERHVAHEEAYLAAVESWPMGSGLEVAAVRKDGSRFPAEIALSPVATANGPLVIATVRDATERKRAQEQLALRSADLERSNRDLEQFAYVASHDLQEPLRMVSSYTQLLGERYGDRLDADARDFIGFAVDGAKRMQILINDLLTYSRVGNRAMSLVPTDCHDVLGRSVVNLRSAIDESCAIVTNDELPVVTADGAQLVQVFQNLIGNGIKFRREGVPPRIHVSARQDGDEWVFSVADNGIGIPAELQPRLFVIFQRLHTRETYPGTGIGLAICKRIVERHGGRIWIDSEPGRGTTFLFTIPVEARRVL